jgi:hypothetical protein
MRSALLSISLACAAWACPPALAQGSDAPLEGVWRGTLACSEGSGPAGSLQPYTVPLTFTVTGRLAVVKTDTDELIEQTAVWFEGRSAVRIEVAGVRKSAPDRSWSIRAEGAVASGRFRVEAPMFRADGRTLVRRACVFDMRLAGAETRAATAGGAQATAPGPNTPAAPTPLRSTAPASTSALAPAPAPSPQPARTPAPTPALNALSTEEWARLMARGTEDPRRQQEFLDFLKSADAAMRERATGRERLDGLATMEARVALALLNSADALDLSVHLDKQHPSLKRELSGAATLGDGRTPVKVLLLDGRTRVTGRTLLDSAALGLLAETEPAKLQQDGREVAANSSSFARENPARSQDQRLYLALLTQKLREILAAKGIRLASLPDPARSGPDLSFTVADASEGPRSQGLQAIGRDHALVITFDAQREPQPGIDAALMRSAGRPESARERAALTDLAQALQARLGEPRFEPLASIAATDLAAARTQQLEAQRKESERLRQEMVERLDRIRSAAAQNTELAGALRVYRKGKSFGGKPEEAFCTVKASDAMVLLGLVRSPEFAAWSRIPAGKDFSAVYDSADDLYAAINQDKCHIVAGNAPHLHQFMTALGRDGQFAYNVGPTMNRDEAREPFAVSQGFENHADLEFAQKHGNATPAQVRALKGAGAGTAETFKAAVGRMNSGGYSTERTPSVAALLQFLDDEAQGRKAGRSAIEHRRAEDKRAAEEERLREEQAAKERERAARERAERAKAFPYLAVLTCGMGSNHINVLACFAAQGSSSVDTELRLTHGDSTRMFKAYSMREAGQERSDGFHIELRKNFSIQVQNSHGTLILGLKIIDRATGKVMFEKQAAKFDVISVAN